MNTFSPGTFRDIHNMHSAGHISSDQYGKIKQIVKHYHPGSAHPDLGDIIDLVLDPAVLEEIKKIILVPKEVDGGRSPR
jgi:hypothetical protein